MKQSIALQLGLFGLAITLLGHCKPHDPVPDSILQREDTLSIAQVRTLAASSIPSSVRITDAGKEGVFRIDAADLSSTDNLGTILVTAKGHRYKREYSGAASAAWFGVTPTATDISAALQLAINATSDLFIPDGSYNQLAPVNLKSNLTIRGNTGKVLITLPQSYVSLINAPDPAIPLEHVLIDGLSWNTVSKGAGTFGTIYIDGPSVTDLTVQNCTSTDVAARDSTNWLTVKIKAGRMASGIVVRNNTVQAKRMGCEIFNHDNYGIYAGKNITVSGNNFHDCWFGISLSGPLDSLTVSDNQLTNCSLFGVEIAGASRNVQITHNTFRGVFDKFLTGSNDGSGTGGNGGSVVGGMVVTDNSTIGICTGGIQIFNGGAMQFSKNVFRMTGMLELAHSTAGGTFTENTIESGANKAVICDNSPNNTFRNNTISNKSSEINQATFMAYGSKATNNTLINNRLIQGEGGKPYDAVLGGSCVASMNYDESGKPIP